MLKTLQKGQNKHYIAKSCYEYVYNIFLWLHREQDVAFITHGSMFQRLHEGLNVAMITQISEWLQWGLLNGAKITLRSSLCYNYIEDWMLLW